MFHAVQPCAYATAVSQAGTLAMGTSGAIFDFHQAVAFTTTTHQQVKANSPDATSAPDSASTTGHKTECKSVAVNTDDVEVSTKSVAVNGDNEDAKCGGEDAGGAQQCFQRGHSGMLFPA